MAMVDCARGFAGIASPLAAQGSAPFSERRRFAGHQRCSEMMQRTALTCKPWPEIAPRLAFKDWRR
jgi:hypothetical protein